MKPIVLAIFVLSVVFFCAVAFSSRNPAKNIEKNDEITIFMTGNELGALKPCGCSGGQLGGLDRRAGILNTGKDSSQMIIDTGSLVKTDSEQDHIKFDIIMQAFEMLGYDMVHLTAGDIEIARDAGLLDGLQWQFQIIASETLGDSNMPTSFTKKLLLNNKPVTVTVAASEKFSSSTGSLFPPRTDIPTVNILILNQCDHETIKSSTNIPEQIDCIICPSEYDEPEIISKPNKKPLIISVGQLGKHISKLSITQDGCDDALKLALSTIDVTEDIPQQQELVDLYRTYQLIVKDANLLEKMPRFSLPEALNYVGSESCKVCHTYEYQKWSANPHASAFATLEQVGNQYDPECVICHVIGNEYETGYVSQAKNSHLKNVGCENCHGPGSEHIASLGTKKTVEPKSTCEECHTSEHSANYAGNENIYFEKIIHWREPNSADNVK
ncbi:multiheme c-type cytochrome [Planctomycetota bacterium]